MRAITILIISLALLQSGNAISADLDNERAIAAVSSKTLYPDEELVFIVLGDSRGGEDIFTKLLEQTLLHQPQFLIHTGDFVYAGQAEELSHYETLIASYPLPIIHLAGNHDVSKDNNAFKDLGGMLNWSFDIGDYRFLGLDTSTWNLTDDAMGFARRKLESNHQFFVAFHHPPNVGRWQIHAMSSDEEGGRGGELMQMIEQVHTRGAFLGHIHLLDEMRIGGIPYFISGGAGVGMAERYGFGVTDHGYLVVRIKYGIVDYEWVTRLKSPESGMHPQTESSKLDP